MAGFKIPADDNSIQNVRKEAQDHSGFAPRDPPWTEWPRSPSSVEHSVNVQ